MKDFAAEIEAAVVSEGPIARAKVVEWIDSASDLPTLAKLYRLTDESYARIKPDLGSDSTCGLIQRYLLECIRQDATGTDEIQDRWEATRTLHAWFCHLATMDEDNSAILRRASDAITELFLTGSEDVRNAVEQGFLEHALEMEALRAYFEHWSADPVLREAWERALEWGKAHPNFTWGLLQQLKRMQEE
jgi:hypothetical protein